MVVVAIGSAAGEPRVFGLGEKAMMMKMTLFLKTEARENRAWALDDVGLDIAGNLFLIFCSIAVAIVAATAKKKETAKK